MTIMTKKQMPPNYLFLEIGPHLISCVLNLPRTKLSKDGKCPSSLDSGQALEKIKALKDSRLPFVFLWRIAPSES